MREKEMTLQEWKEKHRVFIAKLCENAMQDSKTSWEPFEIEQWYLREFGTKP